MFDKSIISLACCNCLHFYKVTIDVSQFKHAREILFEISNVRNNWRRKSCTNWLNKHKKSIWKLKSMYLYTASGLQFEKVFNGSLFSIFRKIFIYILFDHQTVWLKTRKAFEEPPMQVGDQITSDIPLSFLPSHCWHALRQLHR